MRLHFLRTILAILTFTINPSDTLAGSESSRPRTEEESGLLKKPVGRARAPTAESVAIDEPEEEKRLSDIPLDPAWGLIEKARWARGVLKEVLFAAGEPANSFIAHFEGDREMAHTDPNRFKRRVKLGMLMHLKLPLVDAFIEAMFQAAILFQGKPLLSQFVDGSSVGPALDGHPEFVPVADPRNLDFLLRVRELIDLPSSAPSPTDRRSRAETI